MPLPVWDLNASIYITQPPSESSTALPVPTSQHDAISTDPFFGYNSHMSLESPLLLGSTTPPPSNPFMDETWSAVQSTYTESLAQNPEPNFRVVLGAFRSMQPGHTAGPHKIIIPGATHYLGLSIYWHPDPSLDMSPLSNLSSTVKLDFKISVYNPSTNSVIGLVKVKTVWVLRAECQDIYDYWMSV